MDRFKAFWLTLPTPSKAIALAVVIGIALFLIGGAGGLVSAIKDRAFAHERDSLKKQIEEKSAAGDASESRARAAEGLVAKQDLIIELAGKEADKAEAKVADAERKFNEETEHINTDIDNCTRLADLRAKLHLPPVPCQQATASPGGQ